MYQNQIFIRNLRAFFALLMLDTSLLSNYNTMMIIKKEALNTKNLEAFLESAPQIILQGSIIIRTGNISKNTYDKIKKIIYQVIAWNLARLLSGPHAIIGSAIAKSYKPNHILKTQHFVLHSLCVTSRKLCSTNTLVSML